MELQGVRVKYLHHKVETMERTEILRDLRLGVFDVLVGINLLREGLDIPEVSLVAILDADKEGLLRSETALIQTVGRAARNVHGKVIFYADKVTSAMEAAMTETAAAAKSRANITPPTVLPPVLWKNRCGISLSSAYPAAERKAQAVKRRRASCRRVWERSATRIRRR